MLFSFNFSAFAQVSQEDFDALRAFYNATGGDIWLDRTGWENINTTAVPDDVNDTWALIQVGGNRVVNLGSTFNFLTGSLPAEIGDLTGLTSLTLFLEFGLTGEIPEELGNLTNLELLNISFCDGIEGAIPSSFGNLESLTSLNITFCNSISGSIPSSLGNLSNLEAIRILENTSITGTLPETLGNLTNLTLMDLSITSITGEIPEDYGNLVNLLQLYLSNNQLTGAIPASFGSLSLLTNLNLNNNQLTGEIPESFENLVALEQLFLNDNMLQGIVPKGLQNFTNLNTLRLENNQFASLPDLSALPLVDLQVQNNALSFKDLEPNLIFLGNPLNYSPQNPSVRFLKNSLQIDEGAVTTLELNESGQNTQYTWYRVGEADPVAVIQGDSTYSFSNFDISLTGQYYCVITHPFFPELTFTTDTSQVVLGQVLTPTDFNVEATTREGIALTWTDASASEDGYLIERAEGDTRNFTELVRLPQAAGAGSTLNFTDTNITPNVTYFYRVRALSTLGIDSDFSEIQGTSIAPIVNNLALDGLENRLNLSPNPTVSNLKLEINHPRLGDLQINVFDMLGIKVMSENFKKNTIQWQNTLNLENYPQGLYLIKIRLEEKEIIRKVQKW